MRHLAQAAGNTTHPDIVLTALPRKHEGGFVWKDGQRGPNNGCLHLVCVYSLRHTRPPGIRRRMDAHPAVDLPIAGFSASSHMRLPMDPVVIDDVRSG